MSDRGRALTGTTTGAWWIVSSIKAGPTGLKVIQETASSLRSMQQYGRANQGEIALFEKERAGARWEGVYEKGVQLYFEANIKNGLASLQSAK